MTQRNIGGTVYEGDEVNGYFIPKKVVTYPTGRQPLSALNTPSWWRPSSALGPVLEPGMTVQDATAQYVANEMIRNMIDPYTQLQTAEWLGRTELYPKIYFGTTGANENINPDAPTETQRMFIEHPKVTQSMYNKMFGDVRSQLQGSGYMTDLVNAADPDRLKDWMPDDLLMAWRGGTPTLEGKPGDADKVSASLANWQAGREARSGMEWLQDYLRTVEAGTKIGQTRAAQRQTKGRLATLEAEADDPTAMQTYKPYKVLAQNMVSPYVQDRPFESLVTSRNAGGNWSDAYQRGGLVYRNRRLT